jgi:putative Mg2+ transporter-C (MgtC) family protein
MVEIEFTLRVACAFILGTVIGLERQWRQRAAGLRTNVLVALGSALFVLLGSMIPGESSPTRVAAQIVSGIGFLGGGVILREGVNVRGLNTAGTLWCSAAIGTLTGFGLLLEAAIGAGAVLGANVLLRRLAQWVDRRSPSPTEVETSYQVRAICREEDETHVRTLLLYVVNSIALTLHALSSADMDGLPKVEVKAELSLTGRDDRLLEQIVSRLSLEPGVSAVSWEILSPQVLRHLEES